MSEIIKRTDKGAKTATHKTKVVPNLNPCHRCAFTDSDACAVHQCAPQEFPEQQVPHGKTIVWVPRKRTLRGEA